MAHLGHGVIGDPMYGKPMRSGQMPDAVARDCLHPVTGEALHFETPMPDDMAGLVAAVKAGIARRATAPKNR